MKIIISHDIDHLNVSEHFTDLILVKFIARAKIELFLGKISLKEFFIRMGNLFSNRWNRVEELIEFNKQNDIPSTFFIGVNNGVGLNYPLSKAQKMIKFIQAKGVDIGVHGIEYDNLDKIKFEFERFSKIIGHNNFGIRMHYLRQNDKTFEYLSDAGYKFDCSKIENGGSSKINNMYEFPVHIMDGWMLNENKSWQVNNLQKSIDKSKYLIENGLKNNIDYFSILFHDRYFSNSFKTWKLWYIKTIEYLIENKFEFVSYREAVETLTQKN